MTTPPPSVQDHHRLGADGFVCDNVWYHGTSSGVVESIRANGLLRSGDTVMETAVQGALSKMGESISSHPEPVFLTPSAALAWYWAVQTAHKRHRHVGSDETPVVLAITLPDALNQQVKPDVGAASVLMHPEGEDYLAYLSGIYQAQDLPHPGLEPIQSNREDYLIKLGLAYSNSDIPADCIRVLQL